MEQYAFERSRTVTSFAPVSCPPAASLPMPLSTCHHFKEDIHSLQATVQYTLSSGINTGNISMRSCYSKIRWKT